MTSLNSNMLHKSYLLKWLFVLSLAIGFASAFAQSLRSFDHLTTGFPLTGIHASTPCEACHKNGVFLGTPRTCATCHVNGSALADSNVVRPANHFQTPLPCSSCHTTNTFAGARFDHVGVAPTACASCHNSVIQPGKPFGHIVTEVTCSQCHTTKAWLPATGMDHSTFTDATNCTRCHNGVSATGKSASHFPTASNCASCHFKANSNATGASSGWLTTKWNHTQMPVSNQCSVCHTGAYSHTDGKPINHIPYQTVAGVATANCDTCHKNPVIGGALSGLSWSPGRLHSNATVSTQCATCHLSNPNTYGVTGKPSNAIHTTVTGNCESCHVSTSVWIGVKPNHSAFNTSTNCISCHNGTAAPGQNAGHFITALNCETCHSPTVVGWKPTKWNHTQMTVPNQCSTCHSGAFPPADGKPTSHIPYAGLTGANNCDSCHKGGYTSWYPGRLHSNISVTAACETCHVPTTYGLTVKPSTPIHSGVTSGCESCHNTSSWFGAKPSHAGFNGATTCTGCHNGSAATGQNSTHFPTAVNCVSCHSPTQTSWRPTAWNHTQVLVAAQCATCHTGTFLPADGKNATHIPYAGVAGATNCDSCHKGGYATWNPGFFHTNISVSTGCVSCHQNSSTSSYAVTTKPFTGRTAATHATVTGIGASSCESCHTTTTSWVSSMPSHASFNAATDCLACHGPGGSSGVGKSANHIQTSANCVTCHSPQAATWRPSNWKHNQGVTVTAACATCHNGTIAIGKPSQHISTIGTVNCDTCHASPINVTTPLWKPTTWNHTQMTVANTCGTCHDGSHAPADGKTANHVPYAVLASATNCDSCHKGGYSTWNPGRVHANLSVTTQCETCHLTTAYGATGKPATAIHASVTGNCQSCHTGTSTWLGAKPNHSAFTSATVCSTCHNGTTATGKTGTHIPTGATNCVSCHSATLTVWKPSTWNHTQMPVTNQCATCHAGTGAGTYPPADGKTANHIPYGSLTGASVNSASSCDACHKAGYISWRPGEFHRNVSVLTQCATCHLNTQYGVTGKPATTTHTGVTGNCESCHRSPTSWLNVVYTHSAANKVGNGTCETCHNGTTAKGKTGTHIPVSAPAYCETCHINSVNTGSFANPTMDHTKVTATSCKTCHSGMYLSEGTKAGGALGKPTNHIPHEVNLNGGAAMDCNFCHTTASRATGAWGLAVVSSNVMHNGTMGNGNGSCKACHATGTAWLGPMERKSLSHDKAGKTDCSQAGGCHIPLGTKGVAYTRWK